MYVAWNKYNRDELVIIHEKMVKLNWFRMFKIFSRAGQVLYEALPSFYMALKLYFNYLFNFKNYCILFICTCKNLSCMRGEFQKEKFGSKIILICLWRDCHDLILLKIQYPLTDIHGWKGRDKTAKYKAAFKINIIS